MSGVNRYSGNHTSFMPYCNIYVIFHHNIAIMQNNQHDALQGSQYLKKFFNLGNRCGLL